jgi:hypothetical protein
MKRYALVLTLLLLPIALRADPVDLGTHGSVSIDAPKGWTTTVKKMGDSGSQVTIEAPADMNAACVVLITVVPNPEPLSKEKIQALVLDMCDQTVDSSVEKKKVLHDLDARGGYASYCVFTDASMVGKPVTKGQFKVSGIGIVHLSDEVLLSFGVDADDASGPEFAAMLSSVAGATLTQKK